MFDSQLQFERLEQIPEQYRREAARYSQRQVARQGEGRAERAHPLRRRFAAALRRVADVVEPAPHHPPLNA